MRVPSLRSGSIWKIPPWAQSEPWIFIDTPEPARFSSIFSVSIEIVTALVSVAPRTSGTLLANTGVNRPPVMSFGPAMPVNASFSVAKSARRTSNWL